MSIYDDLSIALMPAIHKKLEYLRLQILAEGLISGEIQDETNDEESAQGFTIFKGKKPCGYIKITLTDALVRELACFGAGILVEGDNLKGERIFGYAPYNYTSLGFTTEVAELKERLESFDVYEAAGIIGLNLI